MKLHLGCGSRYIPGWVHVDVVPFPHIDLQHSIDRIPMLEDGCASVIYACHVLEHFVRADVQRVLAEWRRLLQTGGVLRIAVPDFNSLMEIYLKTSKLKNVIGPLFGRQNYLYNIHRNVFDLGTLRDELETAGFQDVRRYDWHDTEHASVDDFSQAYFPHMDRSGVLISLNVEAIKP